MFKSTLNRLASWIALIAIIFASLAPTISYALPTTNAASFQQEICDAQGVKRIVSVDFGVEQKSSPDQNQSPMLLEHCPYCVSHMTHVGATNRQVTIFLAELNAVSRVDIYSAPLVQAYFPISHPAHAPPLV